MRLPIELEKAILNKDFAIHYDKDSDCIDFEYYSSAGQDFMIPAEFNGDLQKLSDDIYDYYNCFDVGEATYCWLDNTGHGKNGAPYNMKDVIADMEECEKAIYKLFLIIDEYYLKNSEQGE